MIALVNLGNSNIQSVINTLNYLKIDYVITNKKKDIAQCNKIILPGVGTFSNSILKLKELDIFDMLKDEVLIKDKPILGICLGMQLFFQNSEESDDVDGLCLLRGKVVSIPKSRNYSIPRIGWADSKVNFDFLGLKKDNIKDFYYIHSYHVQPNDKSIIAINTDDNLTSAIKYKNIYGCQFHPEKSHLDGFKILESFSKVNRVKV